MRNANILSVALHNSRNETDPEARASQNLDQADDYVPDLVGFSEACLHHAARNDSILEDVAEPIPGPETDAVAEKVSDLDSYVVLPMFRIRASSV